MDTSRNGAAGTPPPDAAAYVSPVYHQAKNEIVRPHQAVSCSRYFVERWMPRLGGTATCVVLFLRSLGGSIPEGEAAVQVNQDDLARAAGCSDRTLRRELKENEWLSHFVRTEDRFVRGEKGHVRRVESVYYIAMDDPLVPEDEPRLLEIVNRKEAAPLPAGKVILPDHLSGQNGRIRAGAEADKMAELSRPDKMAERFSETYVSRNVPGTRQGGATGTNQSLYKYLEEWRRTTEDLARHSSKELDDQNSLGYHIMVWNHARKHDRRHGKGQPLTDGVFQILGELTRRRNESGQPQGRAWTRRTRKWFDTNGVPLSVKETGALFDEAELESVRAALAGAPFVQASDSSLPVSEKQAK